MHLKNIPRCCQSALLVGLLTLIPTGAFAQPNRARHVHVITLDTEVGAGPRIPLSAVGIGTDTVLVLEKDRGLIHAYRISDGRRIPTAAPDANGDLHVPLVITKGSRPRTVVALDGKGSYLVEYVIGSDSIRAMRRMKGPEIAFGVCRLGDGYAILGYRAGTIVHRYSFAGSAQESFGLPFRQDNPLLERSLTRGSIACDPDQRRVFVVSRLVPDLRAYTSSGTALWQRRLNDYRQITITQRTSRSVSFESPPAGHHQAIGLFVVSHNRLLLQLGLSVPAPAGTSEFATIETRLIDADSGEEISRSTKLPRVIGTIGDRIVVDASDRAGAIEILTFRMPE